MKDCSKCGEQNPDEAKFCKSCGEPFVTKEKTPSTTAQSSSNSSGGKVAVVIIVVLAAIIGIAVFVANQDSGSSGSYTPSYSQPQQTQDNHNNYVQINSSDCAKDNIQLVLSRLSSASSKSGNQSALSSLYASEVNPYVKWGSTKYAKDLPSAMRQFLDRYDYYEVSVPTDLSVKPYNDGYVATYNILVEWNSQRTGHKKACIQKTTYFDSNYKITGFIDNELWRQSL